MITIKKSVKKINKDGSKTKKFIVKLEFDAVKGTSRTTVTPYNNTLLRGFSSANYHEDDLELIQSIRDEIVAHYDSLPESIIENSINIDIKLR